MPVLDAYLFFDGNCAHAMRFYERVLGGRLETMMRYGDAPQENMPPGDADRIMHARLSLGDRALMASDGSPGEGPQGHRGFSLSLNVDDAAEARRLFDALAEGGQVRLPIGPTFWAEAFGMLVDRFGTPWMINGGEHAKQA